MRAGGNGHLDEGFGVGKIVPIKPYHYISLIKLYHCKSQC